MIKVLIDAAENMNSYYRKEEFSSLVNENVQIIKDYVEKMPSKAQSLIIGISGGIDSSVSSTLSAMTGIKTIVLSMPIKQKTSQHDLSLKHQEWLVKNFNNVEAHIINLDKLFKTFENSLSKFDSELGLANSRARLRMTTLYQVVVYLIYYSIFLLVILLLLKLLLPHFFQ